MLKILQDYNLFLLFIIWMMVKHVKKHFFFNNMLIVQCFLSFCNDSQYSYLLCLYMSVKKIWKIILSEDIYIIKIIKNDFCTLIVTR